MEVITGVEQIPEEGLPGCVVTWGVFDGVHLAHQKILKGVVSEAKLNGTKSVAITFDRHPEEILFGKQIPLITTLKERLTLIGDTGIDTCVIITFTKEFALTKADQFVKEIIKERLKARGVVLGYDSRFGHDREGDFSVLQKIAKDIGLKTKRVAVEEFKGRAVSSTLIRDLIQAGRMQEANRLLGKEYQVRGKVIHGDSRGKELGFPTANLQIDNDLRPHPAVYGARCLLDGKKYPAVVNIGVRPTFEGADGNEVVEVHVLDYTGADFYDRFLEVEFLFKIRVEKKFRSQRSLVQQIKRDIKEVRDRA
jgi:riboflavin kinase/FMN adenylyltransferase